MGTLFWYFWCPPCSCCQQIFAEVGPEYFILLFQGGQPVDNIQVYFSWDVSRKQLRGSSINSLNRKSIQIPLSPPATCAAKSSSVTFLCDSGLFHTNLPLHASFHPKPPKTSPTVTALLLTNGRLCTAANMKTTSREHSSTLRLPKLNENPSPRVREKECILYLHIMSHHHIVLGWDELTCLDGAILQLYNFRTCSKDLTSEAIETEEAKRQLNRIFDVVDVPKRQSLLLTVLSPINCCFTKRNGSCNM